MKLMVDIALSNTAAVVTDPNAVDNPIVSCNAAFTRLTGYAPREVLGRNCRLLCGAETDPDASTSLGQAVRRRRPAIVELVNYRKDGSRFLNAVMIAPVYDRTGRLVAFVGSQSEVNSGSLAIRTKSENRVEQLPRRQKEVLLGITQGKPIKLLAHELGISERTIKLHRAAALRNLCVRTNAEAIRLAIEAGY